MKNLKFFVQFKMQFMIMLMIIEETSVILTNHCIKINTLIYLLLQENVTLIKEINDLRRELKIARTQVHDLEAALGVLRRTQGSGGGQGAKSAPSRKNTSRESTADDLEKIITIQKNEIRKLREQIHDLENQTINRPPSGGRLPPVPVS
jgi:chromosome segregation ATPase